VDAHLRFLILTAVLAVAVLIYFAGPAFFGLEAEGPGVEPTLVR
jgi:hypothetical protein